MAAQLTISNQVTADGKITFGFAGFIAYDTVQVQVLEATGAQGIQTVAANQFGGNGNPGTTLVFQGLYPGGTYTLFAESTLQPSISAMATFTVANAAPINPTISISPGSAILNAQRTVQINGFLPNNTINVVVLGGGGFTMTTDSSGSSKAVVSLGDAVGDHTLQASDLWGNTTSVTFTVTGTPVTASWVAGTAISFANNVSAVTASWVAGTAISFANNVSGAATSWVTGTPISFAISVAGGAASWVAGTPITITPTADNSGGGVSSWVPWVIIGGVVVVGGGLLLLNSGKKAVKQAGDFVQKHPEVLAAL